MNFTLLSAGLNEWKWKEVVAQAAVAVVAV